MNSKINKSLSVSIALAVALAIALLLSPVAMAFNPSQDSYPVEAEQSSQTAVIPSAQAQPAPRPQAGYVPQMPTQESSHQSLTLPQVQPQTAKLPGPQGAEGSLELPIKRQPNTSVARIALTATDRSGRWLPNLSKQDFVIYEDGIERPILGIQRDSDTPVSVGIVVDTSGSMDWKLAAAKAALNDFAHSLNQRDEVFLVAFSTRAFLLQDFTDPSDVTRAIGMLRADGRTALYDAVVSGLRKVERGRYAKKALLVITDGIDNASGASLGSAIAAARSAGVLIYTVGIGSSGGSAITMRPVIRFGGFGFRVGGDADDERVDAATLRQLSDETGATTFILNPRSSNLAGLDSHFQRISDELREQYSVRFESAGGSRPHQIRAEAVSEDVRVRAPKWMGRGSAVDDSESTGG